MGTPFFQQEVTLQKDHRATMDKDVQRGLSDRLYDKRKVAALELEALIRECLAEKDHERIKTVIDQLCRDFAYAVHHPNARNGGLIGLAAAAIALGQNEVAAYLEDIIHPVLACFGDQDARVRYYACESMYNIAKVAKGEILLYFNEIFDALAKLATDSEPSVKNGADLLDRLIKDIVSEKAATYVSVIHKNGPPQTPSAEQQQDDPSKPTLAAEPGQQEMCFSLPRFIPLLMERIYAINPYARMFLVSWITLLDSIPDLELVSYLPSFFGGLISFLGDPSKDVRVATHAALDGFLQEIRRITEIKKQVQEHSGKRRFSSSSRDGSSLLKKSSTESGQAEHEDGAVIKDGDSREKGQEDGGGDNDDDDDEEDEDDDDDDDSGLYIPGQDVYINFGKVIEILISHLDSSEQETQVTVLNWIENLLEMSPLSLLPYGPRLLSVLLPTMAHDGVELRQAAERVNQKMLDLITSLPEQQDDDDKIDYSATVNSLTLHFLNEKEQTRVAALDWLIMLHRRVPKRILAINDGTFPALLKTLSDPSEQVITKDLQLLAQISYNSNDEYFTAFMVNLLNLFSTDRRLLEQRGNLIIRQLCTSLSPQRIYRTMAEILERDDDVEFASTMVQNLNNNLITAPELGDLRMRLRTLETSTSRDGGVAFFVQLFRSWCHNSAAALSLCLLAQAYEHAFMVLQILCEFEITVPLLVQIDKLVQLLESPVFTHLRLQLLEPEKYPYLYKCLYGILMILPQSSAFNVLRNRLNSVSPIGFLQPAMPRSRQGSVNPGGGGSSSTTSAATPTTQAASSTAASTASSSTLSSTPTKFLNAKDDVKWNELLEKFRAVQKKHQDARNLEFTRGVSDLKMQMGDLALPDQPATLSSSIPVTSRNKQQPSKPPQDRASTPKGQGQGQQKRPRGPFGLRRFGDGSGSSVDKKK